MELNTSLENYLRDLSTEIGYVIQLSHMLSTNHNRMCARQPKRGWLAVLLLVGLRLITSCPNLIGAESSSDKPLAKADSKADQSWWSLEPLKPVTPPKA